MVEYKLDSEGTPCEYKTPFRRNTTWHRVPTPALQPLPRASPVPGTPDRLQCQPLLPQNQAAIPRSTSFDRKLPDGTRCQSPLLLEHQGSGPLECEGAREREDALEGSRHLETKWHGPSSKVLSSYKERALQKDGGCKDSPNKLSHIGDKSCSSHSSSNTLSSNTSSNSDDKHFGSGDLMDPELLGLTYIKGASTDSGIDTAPCVPAAVLGPLHLAGGRALVHGRAEQWADAAGIPGPDDEQAKMYAVHGYAPVSAGGAADGSMGDLSEISSHSSGSLDTSKVYIVSHSSGQQIPGSKPYHRQGALNKYVIGWKKSEGSPPPDEPGVAKCPGLFGELGLLTPAVQPQAAAVGDAVAETQHVLSKEDFLKLMLPDSPLAEEGRRKVSHSAGVCKLPEKPKGFSFYGNLSPRRSLYRTLSDESVCSNRRGSSFGSSRSSILDQALPNDILFSTTPPYHSTLPPRTHPAPSMGSLREVQKYDWLEQLKIIVNGFCIAFEALISIIGFQSRISVVAQGGKERQRVRGWPGAPITELRHTLPEQKGNEFWFSDGSISDKSKCADPGLMPLPDTATGLDWSHLVDAARAFEDQRVASFCTLTDMRQGQDLEGAPELPLCVDPGSGKDFMDTTGYEKQDKAVLQAEVQHLRQDNLRLQEESQTATAQLRKFTDWFFNTIDKKP
ncbi:Signal-induced proliferation-associated 1-like protein 2 [Camelus dromedarius]|uniref:Signal-induced proliferation-associated 1-like protein 2 n=1 Tax=Camelus dromedarius TaxID=9838 RepID=A0A5N4DIZ2_CAMDR|nr:Signal-induced proliferation-associated 1-like protein 2 [Camelus dromedarius]